MGLWWRRQQRFHVIVHRVAIDTAAIGIAGIARFVHTDDDGTQKIVIRMDQMAKRNVAKIPRPDSMANRIQQRILADVGIAYEYDAVVRFESWVLHTIRQP